MKYAMLFNKYSKYLNDIDIIIVKYEINKGEFAQFLEKHPNQFIVITYENLVVSAEFKAEIIDLKRKEYKNFAVCIPCYTEQEWIKELNIPFYYLNLIKDWDTLYSYLERGVCAVKITGCLAFEMDKVAEMAHSYNAKVYVSPNIIQRDDKKAIPALKSFFVRPEDTKYYEGLVDAFEIITPNPEATDIIYDVYRKKQWFGNLREIIIGFDIDFDSKYVVSQFGKKRVTCGKKCIKGQKCRMCDVIEQLSHSLEKINHVVIPTKEKKDNDENANRE